MIRVFPDPNRCPPVTYIKQQGEYMVHDIIEMGDWPGYRFPSIRSELVDQFLNENRVLMDRLAEDD